MTTRRTRTANVWLAITIQSTLDSSFTRVEHFIQVVSESRPDAFQNGWLLLTMMRSFHSQLNDIDAKFVSSKTARSSNSMLAASRISEPEPN